MFAVVRMRDATYVVVALALCMLILLVFSLKKPKPISMLDLSDFKTLPYELRTAMRRMLPDPSVVRQRWASMSPDQKQMAIQQLGGMIPQPRPVPMPVAAETTSVAVESKPVEESKPLKKGFLLNSDQKKNPKNKKKNEVVTLGSVTSDDNPPSSGFLGPDE